MPDLFESLEHIKGTVLLNYKWRPKDVDKLELQANNYRGLFFIYNEILKETARLNKENK